MQAQEPPNAFNYSAVARDAAGEPIATMTIGIQVSILQSSTIGSAIYVENHLVNTDDFGLFNLIIGAGAAQTGTMENIAWHTDDFYLQIGMDANGGTNFLTMGITQLMSVPYALHASTADSLIGGVPYTIGLWPELGGYVFWISADGKHGLVAETSDQIAGSWYEAQNAISNPSNHSVNGQKFRDWRMPTKFELNEMYLQKEEIGGFAGNYWSYTTDLYDFVWIQDFSIGGLQDLFPIDDNYPLHVRSVRAF
jgi:hypothetical protein